MEFLILTLCAAKDLNWIGQEFLGKLEESEKLDETRLTIVHGTCPLKRWQKKLYNSHTSTKEFKLGDLVLVYTLKQF